MAVQYFPRDQAWIDSQAWNLVRSIGRWNGARCPVCGQRVKISLMENGNDYAVSYRGCNHLVSSGGCVVDGRSEGYRPSLAAAKRWLRSSRSWRLEGGQQLIHLGRQWWLAERID